MRASAPSSRRKPERSSRWAHERDPRCVTIYKAKEEARGEYTGGLEDFPFVAMAGCHGLDTKQEGHSLGAG